MSEMFQHYLSEESSRQTSIQSVWEVRCEAAHQRSSAESHTRRQVAARKAQQPLVQLQSEQEGVLGVAARKSLPKSDGRIRLPWFELGELTPAVWPQQFAFFLIFVDNDELNKLDELRYCSTARRRRKLHRTPHGFGFCRASI